MSGRGKFVTLEGVDGAGEPAIELGQRRVALRGRQQPGQQGAHLVPGRAIDRPVGQRLAVSEDLLDADPGVWRERAQPYLDDPALVRNIVADGCENARKVAQATMREVREAMGLAYS